MCIIPIVSPKDENMTRNLLLVKIWSLAWLVNKLQNWQLVKSYFRKFLQQIDPNRNFFFITKNDYAQPLGQCTTRNRYFLLIQNKHAIFWLHRQHITRDKYIQSYFINCFGGSSTSDIQKILKSSISTRYH